MSCTQCGKSLPTPEFFLIPYSPTYPPHTPKYSRHPSNTHIEIECRLHGLSSRKDGGSKGFLCENCNLSLIDILDGMIQEVNEEYCRYAECVDACKERTRDPNRVTYTEKEEQKLLDELNRLTLEHAQLQIDSKKIKKEKGDQLQEEKDNLWRDINLLNNQFLVYEEEVATRKASYEGVMLELEKLSNINVYSDAFQISATQQGIGAINSLRLGRLPEVQVEWEEINAAWGQTALLLYTLAKKLSFTFSRFRLVPNGFRPTIQNKDTRVTYPLYGSNSITFTRSFFWTASSSAELDMGMEAFLFCVSELCAWVSTVSASVTPPYYVDKDKIGTRQGGMKSIRIASNGNTDWTKALKYMLANLKRILTCLPSLLNEQSDFARRRAPSLGSISISPPHH